MATQVFVFFQCKRHTTWMCDVTSIGRKPPQVIGCAMCGNLDCDQGKTSFCSCSTSTIFLSNQVFFVPVIACPDKGLVYQRISYVFTVHLCSCCQSLSQCPPYALQWGCEVFSIFRCCNSSTCSSSYTCLLDQILRTPHLFASFTFLPPQHLGELVSKVFYDICKVQCDCLWGILAIFLHCHL